MGDRLGSPLGVTGFGECPMNVLGEAKKFVDAKYLILTWHGGPPGKPFGWWIPLPTIYFAAGTAECQKKYPL